MSYNVQQGDTFQKVASIVYGDPGRENFLKSVNPSVSEPLQAGITLRTPSIGPQQTGIPSDVGDDDVTIFIAGNLFDKWTSITIEEAADNVSTFALAANFEPDDPVMRETFVPLKFDPITISIGREKRFDGVITNVAPQESDSRTVTVSGYSRAGVLQDCPIPPAGELEFFDQNIEQIAAAILPPYAITATFNDDPGKSFTPYVAATVTEKVWKFLSKLCAQRSLVMTSDVNGNLVFQSEASEGVFATLKTGEAPKVTASSVFDPQKVFSSVTAAGPVLIGNNAELVTIENPLLGDVFRPDVFEVRDGFGEELEIAAKSRAGRMYAGATTISVIVEGWRNSDGKLWEANRLISLEAPDINVYVPFEFLIRKVSRSKTNDGISTALDLIFPGSFSGELPESLPWD